MGNYIACAYSNAKAQAASDIFTNNVKVVLPNGTVEEFQTPMVVAELMLEHPFCFVCGSNSSNVPCKTAAMPADARLELGQLYFLLPAHALQSGNGASFEKFNSVQKSVSCPENSEEAKQQQLAGKQVRFTIESLLSSMEKCDQSSLHCSDDACFINLQLQMAYQRYLITRNKLWKPKLESIGETSAYLKTNLNHSKFTVTGRSFSVQA